jgi:phosphatidylinositol 4-kinase
MSFDPNNSLKVFYEKYFGKGTKKYKKALRNLVRSLAGYSLVCYFLQIKDRHNGNILIDNEGHIIHIDFGFLLSNAPGKGLKFENAPFKLSNDMVDCLGGIKGKYFMEFRKLLKKGFLAIHKHRAKIIILVEMMWCGHGKNLECFEMGQETIDALKARLNPKDEISKKNIVKLVDNLIGQSVDNWRTKWYDIFQYHVQGIFY